MLNVNIKKRQRYASVCVCVKLITRLITDECEYKEAVKICLCVCVKLITPLVITQQVVEQLIASREENVFAFVICISNSYLLGAVHKWGYHLGAGIQTLKISVFFHKQRYPQNICQA